MINTPLLIRDYLSAQGAITTLTSTRLFAERDTPPKTYRIEDGAAITFKIRGGGPDYTGIILQPSVQFKCYDSTESKAYTLYRALHDALHDAQPSGSMIMIAREEVHGQTLLELETEWPFTLSFYRIRLKNCS